MILVTTASSTAVRIDSSNPPVIAIATKKKTQIIHEAGGDAAYAQAANAMTQHTVAIIISIIGLMTFSFEFGCQDGDRQGRLIS